jgi:ATP/maltotriose-dependent transcriptional regulator MalT
MFQQIDEEIWAALQSDLQSSRLRARQKTPTTLLNEIAVKTNPLILVLDDYHFLTGNRKRKCIPPLNPNKAN